MKLCSSWTLPSTLLALVLSPLSAFSTPVAIGDVEFTAAGSALLTAENFNSITARGPWMVEFYSPYCSHCRHFAPTWDKISTHVTEQTKANSGSTAGIGMAQVNCVASGDFCKKMKISGYPTMNMYVDGEFKQEFSQERTFENVVKFLEPFAPPPPPPQSETQPESEPELSSETDIPPLKVQETRSNHNVNPDGLVLSLNPANFEQTVTSEPVFVKFFAPWCGHCKKLAPMWVKLAQNLKNKLTIAEVNCDLHSSICNSQGVEGYPMLFFYREGHKLDYTGKRELDAMEAFAEDVMAPAVTALPSSRGDITDLVKEHEVIFLFLHIMPDQDPLATVQNAGNTVLTQPPVHIYTSASPELRSKYGSTTQGPTLIALKADSKGKDYVSTATLRITKGITQREIHNFLSKNAVPLVTELNSANFKTIMSADAFETKPLVVILASKPDWLVEARKKLVDGEEYWRTHLDLVDGGMSRRDVIWTYMDGEKWGSWLKSMYSIKSSKMPTFVIADYSKLIFYNEYKNGKKFQLDEKGFAKAVTQALEGKLEVKHSQNLAQRVALWVTKYAEGVVEMFVNHPGYMLLAIVFAMAVIGWFVNDIISSENSSSSRSRSNGHVSRLRLGEKLDRRLD